MSTTAVTIPPVETGASPFVPAAITTLYPLQPAERVVIDAVLKLRESRASKPASDSQQP